MIENLHNVYRIVEANIQCKYGSDSDYPVCGPDIEEDDKFRELVLGDNWMKNISLDLALEFGSGIQRMSREFANGGDYQGTLWLPGSPELTDSNTYSDEYNVDIFVEVKRLRFFDNRTGHTILDCSGLDFSDDGADHWIDLVARKRRIMHMSYGMNIKVDYIVDKMVASGDLPPELEDAWEWGISEEWSVYLPLYRRNYQCKL